jgi:hypothetical protein
VRWLIACVLAVFSSFANADGPLYADLQFAVAGVSHSSLDFYPQFASVSAGVFLRRGIGLEIFADSGLGSDRKRGFDVEVENAYGIAVRLQSPPTRRVQGFIVIGAVNYSMKQTAAATNTLGGSSIEGDFTGMRISVGILERFEHWDNVLLSLEYRHYNADDPMRVDALLFGLRVNTP